AVPGPVLRLYPFWNESLQIIFEATGSGTSSSVLLPDDPDQVVREPEAHLRHLVFWHVAGDAALLRDLAHTGGSAAAGVRRCRVAGEAARVVVGRAAHERPMRIVAGHAREPL